MVILYQSCGLENIRVNLGVTSHDLTGNGIRFVLLGASGFACPGRKVVLQILPVMYKFMAQASQDVSYVSVFNIKKHHVFARLIGSKARRFRVLDRLSDELYVRDGVETEFVDGKPYEIYQGVCWVVPVYQVHHSHAVIYG